MAFLFKLYVVWDVSRDLFDGGVPTLDLPVVYPVFIAWGVSAMLGALNVTPFPFFGIALWIAIVILAVALMYLFDKLGRPVRDAQLRSMEDRNRTVSDTSNGG